MHDLVAGEPVRPSVLVVDDEPAQRQLMRAALGDDYDVVTAAHAGEAVELLRARSFDVVVTDERMPEMTGSELLRWAQDHVPETPFIVLTAHGSIQTAVEAMRLGACDYLSKPLDSPDELRLAVGRALHERRMVDRNLAHEAEDQRRYPADIVAESEEMREVLRLASQVAPQPTTVLLTGDSGTGKEVVARHIHRSSPRAEAPFVAVNCAALTETLLESEMFGHERGAFTGATQSRRGRFELANGGTLFLDEITEMSVNLQAKLLRVLEERKFERVGGTRTLTADVRVIAATNREPADAIENGALRADLYYRLSVFPIHIPPLRERRQDVLPLAEYLLRRIGARLGRRPVGLSPSAIEWIQQHDWPGNVRELQNALERGLIVAQGGEVRLRDLPRPPGAQRPDADLAPEPGSVVRLEAIEQRAIVAALERNDGDRKATAGQLGISLRTLQNRLKDYGLTRPRA